MALLDLIKDRYSERKFDPRPIEDDKLALILEAGRLAPTAMNFQPQKIYVLKSEEALEKAKTVTKMTYKAPLALLVCYDSNVAWKHDADGLYPGYSSGESDAAIVATLMMHQAAELGIRSVWVRGYDSAKFVEVFNLPENIRPVMLMPLGYARSDSKGPTGMHTDRKSLEEIVTVL